MEYGEFMEPITISRKSALERERILRAEAETLTEVARELAAELDLQKLVQKIVDAGLRLSGAEFGAFFYNVSREQGNSYHLSATAGAEREAFDRLRLNSSGLFGVSFDNNDILRVDDIRKDPRFAQVATANTPDLPLRSYLAAPVVSRSGQILGGLFFGHSEIGVFTGHAERHAQGLAAHAAIAIDNAQLYGRVKQELAERERAEAALRESEEHLKRSEEALRVADQRKDEFLATLAHELRNPLAPLRNGLEVMKLAHDQPQLLEQTREIMEREVQHMVRLIDDLLDVSRITRGHFELRKARHNLCALLENAIATSRPLIEDAGHRLEVEIPSRPIFVEGDDTRLSQVFTNLLNNAAKYTPEGGLIRVTLAAAHDGEARISVKDNGVGIPASMLPHVFDMFTQVDRSLERTQGGLGIGLGLARQLVKMHGGRIEGHSQGQGAGSEFIVSLPLLMALSPGTPSSSVRELPVAKTRHRILVVDDHVGSASIMRVLCTALGNDVRTAHNGLQALEVAEAFRPNVIFMDIGMPNLNGYDACRHIREKSWAQGVVMVALTGWGQDADKQRSREAGFNYHFVKPVNPDTIRQMLAELSSQVA